VWGCVRYFSLDVAITEQAGQRSSGPVALAGRPGYSVHRPRSENLTLREVNSAVTSSTALAALSLAGPRAPHLSHWA
jgi:hypothetical protein